MYFSFCAEALVGGNSKNGKTIAKKAGGLGNRKALDNITNKSTLHHEKSLKNKHLPKEEFNIAEEKFLHDHKKCIEARKAASEPCFLDIVLPGHGNRINPSGQCSSLLIFNIIVLHLCLEFGENIQHKVLDLDIVLPGHGNHTNLSGQFSSPSDFYYYSSTIVFWNLVNIYNTMS